MRIIPTKEQYQKWSLPSKYGYWGLIIGVIGIVFMFVFELVGSGKVIGLDNTNKALEELEIAKDYQQKGNHSEMLAHAKKSFSYDTRLEIREYLGLCFNINKKHDSCVIYLKDFRDKLTPSGKWILATSLAITKDYAPAYEIFEKLNPESIPKEIAVKCLEIYIGVGMNKSVDAFKLFSTNAMTYIEHEIGLSKVPTTIRPLNGNMGTNKVPAIDMTASLYYPGIYSKIGYSFLFARQFHEKYITDDDLHAAVYYMKFGIASGLLTFEPFIYHDFFKAIFENSYITQTKNPWPIAAGLYLSKLHLQNALKGDIYLGGTILGKEFTNEQKSYLTKSIEYIDKTLPPNWESKISKQDKAEIDKQIKSQEMYNRTVEKYSKK